MNKTIDRMNMKIYNEFVQKKINKKGGWKYASKY